MSKKDFMRGVETAVSANEAFMRKQAAATEELGKRIIQKIDEQGQIVDTILDELNAQEREALYHLQSDFDIADLGENEKVVLSSYLLTLISKYDQNTESQKDYYFAVKKHLGVAEVSADFDLRLVENVDSRAELKAIFRTVCEFLFLKDGSDSFLDAFDDELSYFCFGRRLIRDTVQAIEDTYDLLGVRGIVEHYLPAAAEDEEKSVQLETEEWIDPVTVSREECMEIEDMEISVGTEVSIVGELIFRRCKVNMFYGNNPAEFELSERAKLTFEECEIVCFEDYHASASISYDVDNDNPKSAVLFDRCKIIGGNNFLEVDGALQIRKCQIINPSWKFMKSAYLEDAVTVIEDTTIQFDKTIAQSDFKWSDAIFNLKPDRVARVKNCKIIFHKADETVASAPKAKKRTTKTTKREPLSAENILDIAKCGFNEHFSPIFEEGREGIVFDGCEFVNVSDILLNCEDRNHSAFNNCRFVGCTDSIITKGRFMPFSYSDTKKVFMKKCTFTET